MRALFTFIGGLGHFQPLAPLARSLAAAGHEVAVAGAGGLTDRIEAAGFRALPTSAPRSGPASTPPRDPGPTPPADAYAAELEFARNFADKGARRHAVAVQEHLRGWRPDVVVRDEADFGSAIAAEVAGLPTATVLVLAAGLLVRPDLVAEPLAAVRAEHGLAPDPELAMLTRDVVLAPFPPSFRSPESPVHLPEDTFWYRPDDQAVPPSRGSTPRVYVTLGTVFNAESGDLFQRLLAAMAGVEAEVLMTVGRDVDPATLGVQPDHVRIERFVPQAEVLSATDLVVSHGGSGSLMAALAHGLPSVLLPLGADQPHNASRAEELGLARVLDASAASPESIRQAVNAMLDDHTAAARARRIAEELARLPGVEETVPLLERLAGTSR
jgi:UDP:flavonoid glycosyltransferase YjiC (YdhE family)